MRYYINFLVFVFALQVNAQIITTVAGNGTSGSVGDGGQATAAELKGPTGIAFDISGNLYVVDRSNNRIRKITTTGVITTIAGNGIQGFSGDGGQATAAEFHLPWGIALDLIGNLYIADASNHRIRKINTAGIITTVAGNGTQGFGGDGGQATAAKLNFPCGITTDIAGNLYIADGQNNRIRLVNTTGIIITVVGNGTPGALGDGGQATAAEIDNCYGIVVDAVGNLYIPDGPDNLIRKVDALGIISTIGGIQTGGFSGDGGQATAAKLNFPIRAKLDLAGNIYVADNFNNRIRVINTSGIINTIAGNGTQGFSGDGGQATAAELNYPVDVAFDAGGNMYIAEQNNNRIRMVSNVAALGINQIPNINTQVSIYPNPSSGIFQITASDNIDELKVTDILGQSVFETKLHATNATIEIANAGVYFISITSGKETTLKKVVVTK